jgi:hypothetical protein
MDSVTLTLSLPPSAHHKGAARKRQWAEQALATLGTPAAPSGLLRITIRLYGPWLSESGLPVRKQPDWDRLATPIQDVVAKACGFDDRDVMEAHVYRVVSPDECAVVALERWTG